MIINIQPATINDIPNLAFIHWKSKIVAEENIIPNDFLTALTHEEYIKKWQEWFVNGSQTLIAKDEKNNAVGFCSFGDLRTPPPGTSKIRPLYSNEIYAIYVLPNYFGNDIGTALFKETADYLVNHKKTSLCLWALEKNKRACGFYNAMGGQRLGKQFVEMGGAKVKEICFGWRNLKERSS